LRRKVMMSPEKERERVVTDVEKCITGSDMSAEDFEKVVDYIMERLDGTEEGGQELDYDEQRGVDYYDDIDGDELDAEEEEAGSFKGAAARAGCPVLASRGHCWLRDEFPVADGEKGKLPYLDTWQPPKP
jgi:hypothetical protein